MLRKLARRIAGGTDIVPQTGSFIPGDTIYVGRRGSSHQLSVPLTDGAECFAGSSSHQCIVFKHGILVQGTARGDKGILSDDDAVVQRAVVAEKTSIANGTCVADDSVPDRDVIADFCAVIRMQHGIVLDICTGADLDLARICANNHAGPDAGPGTNLNVSDEIGGFGNERRGVDLRGFAIK